MSTCFGSQGRGRRLRGAGIVEYTILIMFFAGLSIAALKLVGGQAKSTLQTAADRIGAGSGVVSSSSFSASSGEVLAASGSGGGVGGSSSGEGDGHGGGSDGGDSKSGGSEGDDSRGSGGGDH